MTFAEFEARLASVLPGLKTKLCLALGAIATFIAAVDHVVIDPIIPPRWQPYMPLVFFTAAYYAHRLSKLHD
jgi:hypothetical protein